MSSWFIFWSKFESKQSKTIWSMRRLSFIIPVTYSIYSSKFICLLKSIVKHSFSARWSPKNFTSKALNLAFGSLALFTEDSPQSFKKNSGRVFKVSFRKSAAFYIASLEFLISLSFLLFLGIIATGFIWVWLSWVACSIYWKIILLTLVFLPLLGDFCNVLELFTWDWMLSSFATILEFICIVYGLLSKLLLIITMSGVV